MTLTTALPSFPWLSLLIFLPLAGALLCLLHHRQATECRWLALGTTLATFTVTVWLFCIHGEGAAGWLRYEEATWVGAYGIRYSLALDGIALLMVLLTALLQVVGVLLAWSVQRQTGLFLALLLTMESGLLGIFLAHDLVLFYLFWEIALIPMFFLIGVWGHERRRQAALKFFLYTLAGSLCMLVAIIALYLIHGEQTGHYSFLLSDLLQTRLTTAQEFWLFAGFLAAFAIKSPIVPLHTWLPDALTEAPAVGSVDLTGLLIKTGIYGLLRFAFPLFPVATATFLPILGVLALIGLFHAAWSAFRQDDIKRLLAYSSISHLGLVLLGLAAWTLTAWQGSLLLMVTHGITTGALFALVSMIRQRTGSRDLRQLGGLWSQAPCLSAFFLLFALASLGLPGLANFAGEILVLLGTFATHPFWAAFGMLGVVFAAAYMLRLVQGVLWGEPGPATAGAAAIADLDAREWLILVPLALITLWLGLYPAPLLRPLEQPVLALLGGLP
ncbi:MAG: NADH-quinone oxidoreductase subunit M [Desulfuromonadales bacterium]|nr:NADH-quinone oxidoreductase subunit M [Desulfuromonadales bacterium]